MKGEQTLMIQDRIFFVKVFILVFYLQNNQKYKGTDEEDLLEDQEVDNQHYDANGHTLQPPHDETDQENLSQQPQQQPHYHEQTVNAVKRRPQQPQGPHGPHHQGYRDRGDPAVGNNSGVVADLDRTDPDVERGEVPMENEEIMDNR